MEWGNYFPLLPQVKKPVELLQVAVNVRAYVDVDVVVTVVVPTASKKRPDPFS